MLDLIGRKAAAGSRRRRAIARAAELLRAPVDRLLGGASPDDLAGRAPAPFPWPDPGGQFAPEAGNRAASVVAAADGILKNRLVIFEWLRDVGRPDGGFDWNWRPSGERLAIFRDDPKFPWEVGRWAAFPRLGAAFVLTGHEEYARKAADLVQDWASRVPVGQGIHYASALEVGIRLIAAAQAWHFFRGTAAFPPAAREALLRQAAAQAAWLEGHLSTERLVAGNHLIGELAGLAVVDLVWPEFGGGARLDRTIRRLAREFELQVAPDGVSREQSATYGRFVADFAAAVLAAAAAAGRAVPSGLTARAAGLAAWLDALAQPDGTLPLVGDNDNGRGADWGEAGPSHDARLVVAMLKVLTAAAPRPVTHLDLTAAGMTRGGGQDAATLAAPGPAGGTDPAVPSPILEIFPDGGHAVLAAGPELWLFLRCGPFGHGLPKPSAHSHADWMAPVLWWLGRAILVDPGNFGYTTAGDERDRFRGEAAHSGLIFRGHPQAVPGAAFRWNEIPDPGRLAARHDRDELIVTGQWATANGVVAAQRTVRYNISQRLIAIEDDWSVDGGGPVQPVWHWRFAPGLVLRDAGGSTVDISAGAGVRLTMTVDPTTAFRLEAAPVSPAYAWQEEAPLVVVEGAAGASGRSLTLFRPLGADT